MEILVKWKYKIEDREGFEVCNSWGEAEVIRDREVHNDSYEITMYVIKES